MKKAKIIDGNYRQEKKSNLLYSEQRKKKRDRKNNVGARVILVSTRLVGWVARSLL